MDDKQKQTEDQKLTVKKKNGGQAAPNIVSKVASSQPQITINPAGTTEKIADNSDTDSRDSSISNYFGQKQESQTVPTVSTSSTTAKQVSKFENFYDVMSAKTSHDLPLDINKMTEEQLRKHLDDLEKAENTAIGQTVPTQPLGHSTLAARSLQTSAKASVEKQQLSPKAKSTIKYAKSIPKIFPKSQVASNITSVPSASIPAANNVPKAAATSKMSQPSINVAKGTAASNATAQAKAPTSSIRTSLADKSIRCYECNCKCMIPIVAASCKRCGCVCSSIRNLDNCSHKFTVTIKHKQTKFEDNKTENKK